MDRSEIFDKIAEVAADVLGVDVAEISDETTFDDLDANSLERLQLVTAIEDEFNLEYLRAYLSSLRSMFICRPSRYQLYRVLDRRQGDWPGRNY